MKTLLLNLTVLTVFSFASSNLISCGKSAQTIESKVGEELDLQKLNKDLFGQLQQIIYDQEDQTFKLQQSINLSTIEVEQFPTIIRENIKWLISLNSFKITNKERIKILNSSLDKESETHLVNNQDQQEVITIPLIEAKKNDLAMEMLLFDNFIKNEKPLVEINVTYPNVIEKIFNVTIEVKNWSEIENKANIILNKIKQEKLEEIIDFSDYKQDWQEAKLLLKLAQHLKTNVTIEQIKKYYFLLKGQKVQFTLDYSKYSLISKFKLSSFTSKMFNELWLPNFNDKNEFEGWNQLIDNETDEEKIKSAIIWNIKLKLLEAVFAIKQEDVSTRFSNSFSIEKAQQFFISDLLFKTAIRIKIDALEEHNQFNVKIDKEEWSNISKKMEEELNAFRTDSTISNEQYKNMIIKNVTVEKIKAYYDYILEDIHQFVVDFNEDLSAQESINSLKQYDFVFFKF